MQRLHRTCDKCVSVNGARASMRCRWAHQLDLNIWWDYYSLTIFSGEGQSKAIGNSSPWRQGWYRTILSAHLCGSAWELLLKSHMVFILDILQDQPPQQSIKAHGGKNILLHFCSQPQSSSGLSTNSSYIIAATQFPLCFLCIDIPSKPENCSYT